MSPQSIIDLATFKALKETVGEDYIDELLQAFYDETPQLLANLQQAFARQDSEAFRLAAHSIKSTSNSFGALQFGEQAKVLEMIGREGNLDGASGKVEALVKGYESVQQELEGLSHG